MGTSVIYIPMTPSLFLFINYVDLFVFTPFDQTVHIQVTNIKVREISQPLSLIISLFKGCPFFIKGKQIRILLQKRHTYRKLIIRVCLYYVNFVSSNNLKIICFKYVKCLLHINLCQLDILSCKIKS